MVLCWTFGIVQVTISLLTHAIDSNQYGHGIAAHIALTILR